MSDGHADFMRAAMVEAEKARGSTGDNPWVGCVIVDDAGRVLGRGHTQGPGEDHAEIGALREARAAGHAVAGALLYSTLEPCSFHGRTPACSRVIVEARLGRVVLGMRDPHPRVDGEGARIVRDAGIDVVEGVLEGDVRRQLGVWVFGHHPHEPLRRARAFAATNPEADIVAMLVETYAVDVDSARRVASELDR